MTHTKVPSPVPANERFRPEATPTDQLCAGFYAWSKDDSNYSYPYFAHALLAAQPWETLGINPVIA
jgi:hypothetical protein